MQRTDSQRVGGGIQDPRRHREPLCPIGRLARACAGRRGPIAGVVRPPGWGMGISVRETPDRRTRAEAAAKIGEDEDARGPITSGFVR